MFFELKIQGNVCVKDTGVNSVTTGNVSEFQHTLLSFSGIDFFLPDAIPISQ